VQVRFCSNIQLLPFSLVTGHQESVSLPPLRTAAGEHLLVTALGHRLAHEGSRRAESPPAVLAAAAAWPGRARSGAARGAAALRDKLKRRGEVGVEHDRAAAVRAVTGSR
jgi:hypothetical protein